MSQKQRYNAVSSGLLGALSQHFDPNLAKGKEMCVAISTGRDECWAVVPKFSFLFPKCHLSFVSLFVMRPMYGHRPTGNKYPDPG